MKLLKALKSLTFDAGKEYGKQLPVSAYSSLGIAPVYTALHQSASDALPTGLYYELRGKIPTNYGRDRAVAWYHHPNMKIKKGALMNFMDCSEGYYFLGGFYAKDPLEEKD